MELHLHGPIRVQGPRVSSGKILGPRSRYTLPTYLFTPCSTVFLEKLTVSQLVKKSPAFYEPQRFITAFTSAHHLSLS